MSAFAPGAAAAPQQLIVSWPAPPGLPSRLNVA